MGVDRCNLENLRFNRVELRREKKIKFCVIKDRAEAVEKYWKMVKS